MNLDSAKEASALRYDRLCGTGTAASSAASIESCFSRSRTRSASSRERRNVSRRLP